MTCTRCHASTAGQPVAMVYVSVDDPEHRDLRFTGVVWCAACLPDGDDGGAIRANMAAVSRRDYAALP